MSQCVVLLTAKDRVERNDRLFLVAGENDVDCYRKFRTFAKGNYELDVDLRTLKYLGDGPFTVEEGERDDGMKINHESGILELDVSNNYGYHVTVERDAE